MANRVYDAALKGWLWNCRSVKGSMKKAAAELDITPHILAKWQRITKRAEPISLTSAPLTEEYKRAGMFAVLQRRRLPE